MHDYLFYEGIVYTYNNYITIRFRIKKNTTSNVKLIMNATVISV